MKYVCNEIILLNSVVWFSYKNMYMNGDHISRATALTCGRSRQVMASRKQLWMGGGISLTPGIVTYWIPRDDGCFIICGKWHVWVLCDWQHGRQVTAVGGGIGHCRYLQASQVVDTEKKSASSRCLLVLIAHNGMSEQLQHQKMLLGPVSI